MQNALTNSVQTRKSKQIVVLDVEHLQSGVSCLTYQLPYLKGPDLHKTAKSLRLIRHDLNLYCC